MTEQEKFILASSEVFRDCLNILNTRSLKYSHPEDPFGNIFTTAEIAGVPPIKGILVRLGDKIGRIRQLSDAYAKGQLVETEDESFEDSILDAINYLVFLALFLKSEGGMGIELALSDAAIEKLRKDERKIDDDEACTAANVDPEARGAAENAGWFQTFLKK